MTWNQDTDDEERGRRLLRIAAPMAALLLLAAAIWYLATQQSGVKRELNIVSTLMPVQMPPPPPPPPKVVEPPKPVQQVIQQPTNAPPPPTPAQSPAANNTAVTENAPAQEGTDAFNIGAGNGSGMTGGGGLGGFAMSASQYGQYARGKILAAVRQDGTLHDKDFLAVVRLWFNAQGAITKVEIAKPTGTDTYDSELAKVLASLAGFNPPPANVIAQMPIQFTIDERHS